MENVKEHWERIYKSKNPHEVSWYAEHLYESTGIISQLRVEKNAAIIDIGGGSSVLADELLEIGYNDITVLDVSETALMISKERLGLRSGEVSWISENVLTSNLNNRNYDLWHDRAVFHFLTNENDRLSYRMQLDKHLNSNGYFILNVFADDGPEKCSGLTVRRHSEADISNFSGPGYKELFFRRSSHFTPSGAEQKFITAVFQKV